ncbi:MAG: hypothetical protein HC819_15720 [Cyclobacteriaceae bacterium]|nr:hypothetical protein [Cyclobacteriaceae bacterium]
MDDFFDLDLAKALVYLRSAGDQANKILLSDEKLLIYYKKKKNTLQLDSVRSLKTERVKLLFPLILGGTLAPFALLSFFVDPYYPWVHLVLILAGLFLLYLGWMGRPSFTVVFKNGDEIQHHLPEISPHLDAFVDFANGQIENRKSKGNRWAEVVFFEVDKASAKGLFEHEPHNNTLFPLYGYTYRQLLATGKTPGNSGMLAIDPLYAGREVKFEYEKHTGMMRPTLNGAISRHALINN